MATPINTKDLHSIISNPRITEKGTVTAELYKAYLFNVAPNATKKDIAKAIELIYKVKPVKIRTVAVPEKKVVRRGAWGVKGGGRKAYVFIRKEDKIEFV